MSYEKYCTTAVTNVNSFLENHGLRFLPKCVTPMSCGYCSEMGITVDLKADRVKWYQELIGTLRWVV